MNAALELEIKNNDLILDQIHQWINTNMFSSFKHEIWKSGLTSSKNIWQVQRKVIEDIECVNWKHWACTDFKEAFEIMCRVKKSPFVIKSEYCEYLQRGTSLFIYKTGTQKSDYLQHLRRFQSGLTVVK